MRRKLPRLGIALLLGACSVSTAIAAAHDGGSISWVVLGPGGRASVRTVTPAVDCPVIRADGHDHPMRVRAVAGVEPLRPTRSAPALSKPSAFPVLTCEYELPGQTRAASVAGLSVPLPKVQPQRIVVIGDTGCRLKAADSAWQACNDPATYPFGRIAAAAAAWKPDLVIHVGDYLYRENPCPEGNAGCAGSPWGYGWDAWKADFFAPAQPLLAAAPWIMVRGNHENCARAGQGWWRFIDPRALEPGRDCEDPVDDALGDYQGAYAVQLGADVQVVVMDIATSGEKALDPQDARYTQLLAVRRVLAKAGARGMFTIAAGHYPILGLAARGPSGAERIEGESAGVQSVFGEQGQLPVPPGIDVILSGHVHLWEQVSFGSDLPSQFIAGFSGTQEDVAALPVTLPEAVEPIKGRRPDHFASWADGFGWMSMERRGRRQWDVEVHSLDGRIVKRCRIDGQVSRCD